MNQESTRSNQLFLYGMILSMFCWGMSWASNKVLTAYGDAITISFFRFLLTFVSLYILLLIFRQPLTIKFREGWKDLIPAALCIALYTYFFYQGLIRGKAGAGGVLVTTLNPVISYSMMLLFTLRRPTMNEGIGLITGIIAGAILLQVWDHWENILNSGNVYFLLASFTWAILSLFTAKSSRYGSPVTFSFWMYGICSVLLLLMVGNYDTFSKLNTSDMYFWGNLVFSSTITTAFATTFYFVATAKLGASRASSFIFLVPCSAAFGSWVFLNEIPQWYTIVGGIIGIGAVYILNKK